MIVSMIDCLTPTAILFICRVPEAAVIVIVTAIDLVNTDAGLPTFEVSLVKTRGRITAANLHQTTTHKYLIVLERL